MWWARQDSNLQPDRYERSALTIELQAHVQGFTAFGRIGATAVAGRACFHGWRPRLLAERAGRVHALRQGAAAASVPPSGEGGAGKRLALRRTAL